MEGTQPQATPAATEAPAPATPRARFLADLERVRAEEAKPTQTSPTAQDGQPKPDSKTDAKPGEPEVPPRPDRPEAKDGDPEESFTDIDPKSLPPELQKIHRDMQKHFTKSRQKEAARVKSAEAKAVGLESELAKHRSWKPVYELYQNDPEFKQYVNDRVSGRGGKPAEKPDSGSHPRSERMQKYLDGLEPEDRKSTLAFIDVVESQFEDKLREKDARIRELEEKHGHLESDVRREADERITQTSAQYQQQFLTACPEFTKLSGPLQKAFLAQAREAVQADETVDPIELFREFHREFKQAQSQHTNAEIERLKADTGKAPPPNPGGSGDSVPNFTGKSNKEIFDHYLARSRSA